MEDLMHFFNNVHKSNFWDASLGSNFSINFLISSVLISLNLIVSDFFLLLINFILRWFRRLKQSLFMMNQSLHMFISTHRANICLWNSRETFPWYILGILGESSQIMFWLNIGIFPECSMNILRILHPFF